MSNDYPCGDANHYDTDNYRENAKRRINNENIKYLICSYCKKDVPEDKVFLAKDGIHHCCFDCY